ncbi:MAG: DMT family transporter [Acidobacteriaceae bacterium]|nr:DMT family transporter [Acidobacteriaceae bacterium]
MDWLIYLAAAASGIANPAQAGANAQLRKSTDHAIFSAVVVYLSGLICVLALQLLSRQTWPNGAKLADVPWWAWMGGILSIASTMAGITLAQKLGSGVFTGITVTASIAMSIAFDNFGWMGFERHTASWPRLAGGALMIAGLWLVARF